MSPPRILAHQGGAAQWPGNSRRAFTAIAGRSVDGVELDVHQTADGVLVVLHDATHDLPEGRVPVTALNAAEIRRYCGEDGPGQGLDEVLALLRPAGFDIQVDVKTDAYGESYPGLLPRLAALIGHSGLEDRVIVSSFLPDTLREVRQLLPRVRLRSGLMPLVTEQLGGAFAAIATYREAGVTILDVNLRMLDARLIEAVKGYGMEVGVGTVNSAAALEHWLRRPIDRILTDEPDTALRARAKVASESQVGRIQDPDEDLARKLSPSL